MKAVIFAGGFGTRISEESGIRPKPMVEIGGKPILWHILKIYSHHGINDFVICCGYKQHIIKDYFADYYLLNSDVTFDLRTNTMSIHRTPKESWKVTLVDTGEDTMTGGRLKRVEEYVGNSSFCLTYGDGVSNVNITELVEYHKKGNKLATLTAVQQPGRFGAFTLTDEDTSIHSFKEKPTGDGGAPWINGGFFVLEPGIFKYLKDDTTIWEREPMEKLAEDGQLQAYRHTGFWQPMDTLRDKVVLEEMWHQKKAPWKVWQ
ncbi:glucose-1-phosphate cytidylyltransferase [Cytophagaceae bacterium DM2B3-1]|uniref:Glucose-1-phosphate cytidylyltransferase n=2 Tax=Xanthocytophaga TaxID=3078918 RepID=A0AAE3QW80_9BACT|nr:MULTISPECIES: glucose-1-phosphate cytidylyltransferase [Xanthocytophaga]MDJ1472928.1 glucose-1-phosphate cytidylyltransferase [Xanthocytophaga flavus]MDJ1483954.1 glucose-1-phosphate cytidylyltransferase [Xanthocytophaga flavus]MDJ1492393.1 glucose-1-phosphate cytidylyltransferase [Xanthocytophaga flavus]MDJ1499860.1 glucose-1-phosphate cytidylyltransferase [Xanthocytophaga agilis]